METAMTIIANEKRDTGSYIPVTDPGRLTNEIGRLAEADAAVTEEAIASAHEARSVWEPMTPDERSSRLAQAASLIEKEHETIARLTAQENGMPIATTRGELNLGLSGMRFLIEAIRAYPLRETVEEDGNWVTLLKKPKGVTACIVPWNAPIILTLQKVIPALLTGNTVVVKPSPLAALGITKLLEIVSSQLPDGVLNVVQGDLEAGRTLSSSPLVRMISFTGGGPTAKHIMRSAADNLKHVHFELGGNDPAVVLEDADMKKTAAVLIDAAFRKSGQYCFAPKRIYVPASKYDEFLREAKTALAEVTIGHQLGEDVDMGPLISKAQREFVLKLRHEAEKSGARMIEAHKDADVPDDGWYMKPALAADIDPAHPLVLEEPFGPLLPIVSYRTVDEAVREANRTEYGLGSSVWGSDEAAAETAARLEAGFTFINRTAVSPFGYRHLPFGGVKQSGIGRENTTSVFEEYVNIHALHGSR